MVGKSGDGDGDGEMKVAAVYFLWHMEENKVVDDG